MSYVYCNYYDGEFSNWLYQGISPYLQNTSGTNYIEASSSTNMPFDVVYVQE
jgi:hypothetical protein